MHFINMMVYGEDTFRLIEKSEWWSSGVVSGRVVASGVVSGGAGTSNRRTLAPMKSATVEGREA